MQYSPTSPYKKGDIVTYQGASYTAIRPSVGVLPTKDSHWAKGGVVARQTEVTTYNPKTVYKKGQVITYNGVEYTAKRNTLGNSPTDGSYWTSSTILPELPKVIKKTDLDLYSKTKQYSKGDSVEVDGVAYTAIKSSVGASPQTSSAWIKGYKLPKPPPAPTKEIDTTTPDIVIVEQHGFDGKQGLQGPVGEKGIDGKDGRSVDYEWRGTALALKYSDTEEWAEVELQGSTGEKGDKGDDGVGLEFEWRGTKLAIKREDQATWHEVDLKGDKGDTGAVGRAFIGGSSGSFQLNMHASSTGESLIFKAKPTGASLKGLVAGDNISISSTDTDITITGTTPPATPGGSDGQLQWNDSGSFAGTTGVIYDYDADNSVARIGINAPSPTAQLHLAETGSGSGEFLTLETDDRVFGSDTGNWTFTSGGDWAISGGNMNRSGTTLTTDEAFFSLSELNSKMLADSGIGRELQDGDVFVIRMTVSTTTPGGLSIKWGSNSYALPASNQTGTHGSQHASIIADASQPLTISATGGWTGYVDGLVVYLRELPAERGIALGTHELIGTNGNNLSFGEGCLRYYDGARNTAFGWFALSDIYGGNDNIAIGQQALRYNMESDGNTAIGSYALLNYVGRTSSDGDNLAIGTRAMQSTYWGSNNIAIGGGAGQYFDYGDYNIFIGDSSGLSLDTGDNNICIGRNTYLTDATDYQLNIGELIKGDMTSTDKQVNIDGGSGQSQNLLQLRDSSDNVLSAFRADGSWIPPQIADASAVNDSVYYSTDASKLVYKDSGGTVNALY